MKLSIITLHYIRNYGSLLQTYATCKMFEKMGHQPEIVDYVRPNAGEDEEIRRGLAAKGFPPHSLKALVFSLTKKLENRRRRRFSEQFLSRYVPMTRHYQNYEDLKNDPPHADIYCTGSDQTWNSEYNGGLLPAYYLDFAPEGKKRIGYSVSIGMSEIPDNERDRMGRYVKQYTAISVREASAKALLEQLGCPNVEQILDPTLALRREEWLALTAPRIVKERYILVYRLNDNPELERFAVELAQKTGCKLVRMSYYLNHFRCSGQLFFCPEVEEFLSLINYAEYVITDSFHCLAFSLNFEKQFYIFYPEKYSARLCSILTLTETLHRAVGSPEFADREIDYDQVNRILDTEREKVERFIRENCG